MAWRDDDRLDTVTLQYRAAGTVNWFPCRAADGLPVELASEENLFGYVTVWWDVTGLQDGVYEVRGSTQCAATPGLVDAPPGVDSFNTAPVRGRIDRTVPVQFGQAEPSDSVFMPGDEISATFNEQIACEEPFAFQVSIEVDTESPTPLRRSVAYTASRLVVICKLDKVSIALGPSISYADLDGRVASLFITNVEDVAGNPAAAVTHRWQARAACLLITHTLSTIKCTQTHKTITNFVL